jgi:hypothetical protein
MRIKISDIAKELIKMDQRIIDSYHLGLRNGVMGIALFYFYYARFTGDERYEYLANYNLKKVITGAHYYLNYFSAAEFADIGRTNYLLRNEKFMEVSTENLATYYEKPLMKRLKHDFGLDFGFCTGITGIGDFFLDKENNEEAMETTFKQIYSALRVKGYPHNPVRPLTLFSPEILRDVKIFFLKLEKANIPIPDKKHLYKTIHKIETNNKVPYNTCQEYSVLQDLREAIIINEKQKIQSSLENITANSFNLIFKGLATLSIEDNSISAWWSLV